MLTLQYLTNYLKFYNFTFFNFFILFLTKLPIGKKVKLTAIINNIFVWSVANPGIGFVIVKIVTSAVFVLTNGKFVVAD